MLLALLIPAISAARNAAMGRGQDFYAKRETGYVFVKQTYDFWDSAHEKTVHRVQVYKADPKTVATPPTDSSKIEALTEVYILDNIDDKHIEKEPSEVIQANLEPGRWYLMETAGFRKDDKGWFPIVVSIHRVPDPPKVEVEAEVKPSSY